MDIRKARELAGITQPELCREAGVGRTLLSLHENGRRPLSERQLAKVEAAVIELTKQRALELRKHVASEPETGRELARA